MKGMAKVLGASSFLAGRPLRPALAPRRPWHERWIALRDLVGGALLLAAWLALWTVTWAAVAGPLRPGEAARAEAADLVRT